MRNFYDICRSCSQSRNVQLHAGYHYPRDIPARHPACRLSPSGQTIIKLRKLEFVERRSAFQPRLFDNFPTSFVFQYTTSSVKHFRNPTLPSNTTANTVHYFEKFSREDPFTPLNTLHGHRSRKFHWLSFAKRDVFVRRNRWYTRNEGRENKEHPVSRSSPIRLCDGSYGN